MSGFSESHRVTQPSAVIFDVGRVLYDWHPRYLYEKLIADDDARAAFLRDVVTTDWHFQHDAGRPFAETAAELTAQHPQHADLIGQWGPQVTPTSDKITSAIESALD